jgi:hypothetical protein
MIANSWTMYLLALAWMYLSYPLILLPTVKHCPRTAYTRFLFSMRGAVLEYNLAIKDYYLEVRGLNELSHPHYF